MHLWIQQICYSLNLHICKWTLCLCQHNTCIKLLHVLWAVILTFNIHLMNVTDITVSKDTLYKKIVYRLNMLSYYWTFHIHMCTHTIADIVCTLIRLFNYNTTFMLHLCVYTNKFTTHTHWVLVNLPLPYIDHIFMQLKYYNLHTYVFTHIDTYWINSWMEHYILKKLEYKNTGTLYICNRLYFTFIRFPTFLTQAQYNSAIM